MQQIIIICNIQLYTYICFVLIRQIILGTGHFHILYVFSLHDCLTDLPDVFSLFVNKCLMLNSQMLVYIDLRKTLKHIVFNGLVSDAHMNI